MLGDLERDDGHLGKKRDSPENRASSVRIPGVFSSLVSCPCVFYL